MILPAKRISVNEHEGGVDAYGFATDTTTTSGEDLPYVGGTASESDSEPEQRLGWFCVRDPVVRSEKLIWCVARRTRNEIMCLPDIEVADTLGASAAWFLPEESAATETSSVSQMAPPSMSGEARTPLGRRLREIRRRIEAGGVPLLDWDGIDRERKERRGERHSG